MTEISVDQTKRKTDSGGLQSLALCGLVLCLAVLIARIIFVSSADGAMIMLGFGLLMLCMVCTGFALRSQIRKHIQLYVLCILCTIALTALTWFCVLPFETALMVDNRDPQQVEEVRGIHFIIPFTKTVLVPVKEFNLELQSGISVNYTYTGGLKEYYQEYQGKDILLGQELQRIQNATVAQFQADRPQPIYYLLCFLGGQLPSQLPRNVEFNGFSNSINFQIANAYLQ